MERRDIATLELLIRAHNQGAMAGYMAHQVV
jgi:hypothetical protein